VVVKAESCMALPTPLNLVAAVYQFPWPVAEVPGIAWSSHLACCFLESRCTILQGLVLAPVNTSTAKDAPLVKSAFLLYHTQVVALGIQSSCLVLLCFKRLLYCFHCDSVVVVVVHSMSQENFKNRKLKHQLTTTRATSFAPKLLLSSAISNCF
jgi:hypothetical protein